MSEYKYVLVSPAGKEHPTDDEVYRTRLLAMGYTEKQQDTEPADAQPSPAQPLPQETDAPADAAEHPISSSVKPAKSVR